MQKVIFILIVALLFQSCSLSRKAGKSTEFNSGIDANAGLLERVESLNITKNNFFIQKADVEIISEGINEKFIANIKFNFPDVYLISVRSKAGIEAARIYITRDTIMINDRINRQLLVGKPSYIDRKFGIGVSTLPVIFGDLVRGKDGAQESEKCVNGIMNIQEITKGARINYVVDCQKNKILSAEKTGSRGVSNSIVKYSKFIKVSGSYFPSLIEVNYMNTLIKVEISKMQLPWQETVTFIPGNKYEIIELL